MARKVQADPRPRVESGSRRASPRPVDWPARTEYVIARDKVCQWPVGLGICGTDQALEVDHIGDRDNHDPTNLRALCKPHHLLRTQQQAQAARQKKGRKRPPEQHPGLRT